MSPRCRAASHIDVGHDGAAAAGAGSPTSPSMQPESHESPPPISSMGRCFTAEESVETSSPFLRQTMDHRSCSGGSAGLPGGRGSRTLQVTAMAVLCPSRCCTARRPRCRHASSCAAPAMPSGTLVCLTAAASSTWSSSPMLTRSPTERTNKSNVPMCGSTMSHRSSQEPRAGRWFRSRVTTMRGFGPTPAALRSFRVRAAFNAFHHALCEFGVI
mmetsp:Transcript_33441/g.92564  ORF Transcript_33441/g.92564 Transcript_33441/m.92564 type:complete len:215 (+) Transcript_33441:354-998(+)